MDNTKALACSKMQNLQQDASCRACCLMPASFYVHCGKASVHNAETCSSPVRRRECLVFAVKDSVYLAHGLVPISLCDCQPYKGLFSLI